MLFNLDSSESCPIVCFPVSQNNFYSRTSGDIMASLEQDMKTRGIPLNVLILEDRESDAELMLHELRTAGYDPTWLRVETESDYRQQLKDSLDLIIADYNLPQFTGRMAIDILNETGLGIPLILVTGAIEETALECLKRGAVDYLLKDRLRRLGPAVKKVLTEKRIQEDKTLALEALRASEQRYRGVAETALTGLSIVDPEEKITYSNPALVKMLGYTANELLGMHLSQIIDPDFLPGIIKGTEKRKQGLSSQYETRMIRKDGETLDVIISASPLTSNDGNFEGSQAVITDITERVHAAREIQQRTEDLTLINKINTATNQGMDLPIILRLLTEESKRVFNIKSATVYIYNQKQNLLEMQNFSYPKGIVKRIEMLIRTSLPEIRIPVKEGSLTQTLLTDGPRIINDSDLIQQWMLEFTNALDLPEKSRVSIRKIIPQIYKLIDVNSVITVPLISAGEIIGLMDFSRRLPFTEEDADRVSGVVGQVISAITSLQAEKEKTRSNHLMLAFSQAAPAVQRANNAKEIYSAIGVHVAKLGIDVTVFTLNEDKDRLFVSYEGARVDMLQKIEKMTGLSAENYSFELKPKGFFDIILAKNEAVFSNHKIAPVEEILPKLVRPLIKKIMKYSGTQQSIIVPLAVRDDVYGLISFSGPDLVETDIPAIKTFANQAGIALEKTRLFNETRELAAFNESVLLSMTEGIALEDTDGIFTFVNPSAEIMLGYPAGGLIGFNWREIVPVDQRALVEAADARRVIGESDQYEMDLITKDGQLISVLASGAPLLNEDNIFTGSIVVFTDITDRKKAEQEIEGHIRRMDALRIIDQAIMSSFELDISLDVILEQLLTQLDIDAAVILSFQEDLQSLQFTCGRGFSTDALQYTNLQLGDGYAGKVALKKDHIFIPDLTKDAGKIHEAPQFNTEGFVSYYGLPLMAKGKLVGVLEIFNRSILELNDEWENYLRLLSGQVAIAIDNSTLFNDLQRTNVDLTMAYDATITGWAHALELKDMETVGHSRRVVDMTMDLVRKMGVGGDRLIHIRRGALLHDIGKMGVPDSILLKHGTLTDDEWELMKQHPVYARNWLLPIQYLRPALDIPYSHHERWDGTGYPEGLSGEQIPLEARIFAIVDVWDALSSDRPYRKAWPREKILAHIKEESGKHFDPRVVEVLLKSIEEDQKLER